jgi:4-hydroxy-3-polyprenylbenzoate decarboxylase
MLFAGLLREKAVEMVRCETVDLEVPAHAEIVLEGYVDPEESRIEGPFGDHTGYYSLEDRYPVFHLTCITHRKDPIYQTTIVGPPPMEDDYMGQAVERLFLPIIPLRKSGQRPSIHNLVVIENGGSRERSCMAFGVGTAMFSKAVIVDDRCRLV